MDLQLRGLSALITGGSRGIGLACARALAAEGCNLRLAARTEADLEAARDSIAAEHGVEVAIHPVDLSVGDSARGLLAACGELDILINNAGAIPGGNIARIDEARWRDAWDLKVFGYINTCREAYGAMKQRGRGVIINVIGAAGERPTAGYIAGSAGNAALMALTRALGANSLRDGIRVLGVNPGLITTDRLTDLMRQRAQAKFGDSSRWEELLAGSDAGAPEQVADLVAFLASPRAAHLSATIITIDGGASARPSR